MREVRAFSSAGARKRSVLRCDFAILWGSRPERVRPPRDRRGALIDRRLHPPERSGCADPERRRTAGIPDDVTFATKPRLGGDMIAAALDAGVTASWVTGDEAYCQDPHLRARLEERGIGYAPAVACSARVQINNGREPARADTVADRLPKASWHRQSAGSGAKGPRHYDWAWVRIGSDHHRHLLIPRNRTTGELAFYRCWSPAEVSLSGLVRVAGARWSVEEYSQAAKGQVGLDHYQVRHWTAWHRHGRHHGQTAALVQLAPTPPASGSTQSLPATISQGTHQMDQETALR
ncbi:IS701 family transposase [Streptomyces sp. B8F3]|uniref:IS701 family transposase n=1 Tax=unclassified Streptomyces TaxID=2593676 RepID=UPI00325E0B98